MRMDLMQQILKIAERRDRWLRIAEPHFLAYGGFEHPCGHDQT